MGDWLLGCRALFGARPHLVRPHKVEALLASPIAVEPQRPIMLEGALQAAAVLATTGRLPSEAGLDAESFVDIPIPIDDGERAGRAVARCSAAFGEAEDDSRVLRQRPRTTSYAGRVSESCGRYKAWQVPQTTRSTATLTWYMQADAERLHVLLRGVLSIGRSRQAGLGHVALWRVTPIHEDRSWLDESGRPSRPLPVTSHPGAVAEFGPSAQTAVCGYRAPYWHRCVQALCVLPEGVA